MRTDNFSIPLLSSIAVHGCAIVLAAFLAHTKTPPPQNYFSVHLLEAPIAENRAPSPAPEPDPKPAPRPVQRTELPKVIRTPSKASVSASVPALPATNRQEETKAPETITATRAPLESSPSAASGEGGGSPLGAVALSSKGEIGVVTGTGTGTGVGGGGTAAQGLGGGTGASGTPAQSIFRANKEAKPIQTARANYPPMALRSGLESDVTLKIEVDPLGNVIKAEIAKSGGGGFDQEALKAVKQSRFEPAQRDGENIAAEFTYVYRFRIRR